MGELFLVLTTEFELLDQDLVPAEDVDGALDGVGFGLEVADLLLGLSHVQADDQREQEQAPDFAKHFVAENNLQGPFNLKLTLEQNFFQLPKFFVH